MCRFALSVLCMTPAVLVACGDNLVPPVGNDETSVDGDDMTGGEAPTAETPPPTGTPQSDDGHGTPRAIRVGLDVNSPSCDAATASFEALPRHVDDGTFVRNARCRVTFDDGAVSDLCVGEHTFARPGAHTFVVEVEDLDTGATARTEVQRVIAVPLEVDLAVEVPACGLELAFQATLSTRAEVHVFVSPEEKFVEPHVAGATGRFQALEPGTYTIRLTAEDERATGPICGRDVSQTVTLTACPPPDCDP
jgi:hypothetical protein